MDPQAREGEEDSTDNLHQELRLIRDTDEVVDHTNQIEHHHPHKQEDETHQQQMQSTEMIGHIHHHPQTNHQTDAHQQDGQEGDAPQTRNGTVVHLTFIGHVEQALEYPRDEQPSQDS